MPDLLIWHAGGPADLTPIKQAKQALNVDFTVKPVAVFSDGENDLPDLNSRVLAVGSRPPFLCDYALTSERTGPEGWQRALRWVLRLEESDPKATTILDTLTAAFGPGVREVSPEELEANQRLRDYQQNRV